MKKTALPISFLILSGVGVLLAFGSEDESGVAETQGSLEMYASDNERREGEPGGAINSFFESYYSCIATTLNFERNIEDSVSVDLDFDWAMAIASFANIQKESLYVGGDKLDATEKIFLDQQFWDEDCDRFTQLFAVAKPPIVVHTN